jgi:hypothetical protein
VLFSPIVAYHGVGMVPVLAGHASYGSRD